MRLNPAWCSKLARTPFLSKEVEAAFEQLGVPVREGKEVAVDAIFDSVSVATTYREKLAEQGIIFCSLARRSTITRNWCVNISAPWCWE